MKHSLLKCNMDISIANLTVFSWTKRSTYPKVRMHLMSLMFLCIMHTTYQLCSLLPLVNHCLFFSLFGGEILPAGQNHLVLKTFGIKYEIMATYITYIDLHPKHDIRFF